MFQPFYSHFEVHHRYSISDEGKKYITALTSIMSIDPLSCVADCLLNDQKPVKRNVQNCDVQIKRRICALYLERTAVDFNSCHSTWSLVTSPHLALFFLLRATGCIHR